MRSLSATLLLFLIGLILCIGNAPRETDGAAIRPTPDYRGSTEEDNVDNIIDNVHVAAVEWPKVRHLKVRFEASHPTGYSSLRRCKPGHRPDAKGRCRPVLL